MPVFVGAMNAANRKFLSKAGAALAGKNVIIGCSGNFTIETILSEQAVQPASMHSNDVSLYSCVLGWWLTETEFAFEVTDPELSWVNEHATDPVRKVATLQALMHLLEFHRRQNDYARLMWKRYWDSFPELVERSARRLGEIKIKPDSYFAGDVREHFQRHAEDPNAVFVVFAPTYVGGYERLYKKLHEIVRWDQPSYPLLTDEGRKDLQDFVLSRPHIWHDDHEVPGHRPVCEVRSGRLKTTWLYSNVLYDVAFFDQRPGSDVDVSGIPLADASLDLTKSSKVQFIRMKDTQVMVFKDMFLGKNVLYSGGMWPFAVAIDGKVAGFIEFNRDTFSKGAMYLNADFAVPHTRYRHLSKLIVMLAISGETGKMLTRMQLFPVRELSTTAFTERPVSMKYRGVLQLLKRGKAKDGQSFLQYGGTFNDRSWQETLKLWLAKNAPAPLSKLSNS